MATKFVKSDKLTRAERLRHKNEGKQSPFVETIHSESEEKQTSQTSTSMHAAKPSKSSGGNVFARPIAQKSEEKNKPAPKRKPRPSFGNQQTTSKRIILPMNKQGAEIQLSTLPFTRFGWRTISGILAVACLVGLIFLSQQKIENIQFIGIQDSLAHDIEAVLNLNGSPIYSIDPQIVSTKMDNAFPKLTDVKIKIQLPKKIIVSAKERTPAYAWKVNDYVYLIDNENLIYPASPIDDISSLIIIVADTLPPEVSIIESSNDIIQDILDELEASNSKEPEPEGVSLIHKNTYTVDGKTIATLQQLLAYLPEEATLIYNQYHGFGWETTQGCETFFGNDLEDMNMKLAVVRAIEQNLALNDTQATLISVEYLHAPYYQEE